MIHTTEVEKVVEQKRIAHRKISYSVFGRTNKNHIGIENNMRIYSSSIKPKIIRKQFIGLFFIVSLLYMALNLI